MMRNAPHTLANVGAALVVGLVVGAGVVIAAEDEEREVVVAKKDVPAAVLAAATPFAEGGALEKAALTEEDGLPVYELHFKKGDRVIEVQVTKAGGFFASGERVLEAKVPDLVKQRAARLFKGGAKVSYERTVQVLYETTARDEAGKEIEFQISEAGAALQEIAGGIGEKR